MADENKIRLGEIWLTDDGTETGLPCVSVIQGLHHLKMKWWGNAVRNARGNVEMNLTEVGGTDLTIFIPSLPFEKVNAIVTLFDDALDDDDVFDLEIQGDAGDYALDAEPNPDSSVVWKEVVGGWATDLEIRIITRAAIV